MIGFLKGSVHTKLAGQVILLVGGVGYLVTFPSHLLNKVNISDTIEVFVYPHIREDLFDLYGFETQEELDMFKLVMSVSGIGPKTAILVVNQGVEKVEDAIKNADLDFFAAIPRLGRKNAQKVIIELKNKIGGLKELDLIGEREEDKEVIEALRSMGYSKQEAIAALKDLPVSATKVEEKLSLALRHLGKSNG